MQTSKQKIVFFFLICVEIIFFSSVLFCFKRHVQLLFRSDHHFNPMFVSRFYRFHFKFGFSTFLLLFSICHLVIIPYCFFLEIFLFLLIARNRKFPFLFVSENFSFLQNTKNKKKKN